MDQKVKIKVQQGKVGSLANVKHKPGGGDKKIFNDVEYMRQVSDHAVPISGQGSLTSSRRESSSQVFLYFVLILYHQLFFAKIRVFNLHLSCPARKSICRLLENVPKEIPLISFIIL